MKLSLRFRKFTSRAVGVFLCCVSGLTHADIITEWNIHARNIVVESKLNTPPANRAMAIVHTSIYKAVNSITQEFSTRKMNSDFTEGASVDAAVASASYTSLLRLLPKQQDTIERVYLTALNSIPDGPTKEKGLKLGKEAAEIVLASRLNDGSNKIDTYRPYTTAGKYVPTVIPAVPNWHNRQPWMLSNSSQFRPGPPPVLGTKQWEKDFNEVKEFGAANSEKRNDEQTAMAKFWEATLPPIYHGVVHSVANQSGRTVTRNARLFAIVTQASDDALIAVFDAKYHYGFWRPVTAIRNGDLDGNQGTVRDAAWTAYIPTPMHPEYPCAHCVVAGTVGAILKAEVGNTAMPILTTSSATANGTTRSWSSVDAFVQEVSDARIYDGVHYRTSTEVGSAMGKQIGELAIYKHLNQ